MDFGTAHKALMKGARVSRQGWVIPRQVVAFDFGLDRLTATRPTDNPQHRPPSYYPTQADMRARDWEFAAVLKQTSPPRLVAASE